MKSMIAAALLGLAAGHFGTQPSDAPIIPVASANDDLSQRTTTTLQFQSSPQRSPEANQAIAMDVETASQHLNQAMDQAPHVVATMAHSISEHGPVDAFLYDDPSVKNASDSFAASLGRGLRALGDAIARDMIEGAKQLHPDHA